MSFMLMAVIFYCSLLLTSVLSFDIRHYINLQNAFSLHDELSSSSSSILSNMTESVVSILGKGLNTTSEYADEEADIPDVTSECRDKINKLFFEQPHSKATEYYIYKLLLDSSTNKNDVNSYDKCMRKTYNFNIDGIGLLTKDFQYILFQIDQTWNTHSCSTEISSQWYALAFCLPKMEECNSNDYTLWFYSVSHILKNVLELNEDTVIEVIEVDIKDSTSQFNVFDIFRMLPLLFILLQVIVVAFDVLPFCMFKLCLKNKYGGDSRSSSLMEESTGQKYNKTLYKQIKLCFNKTENSEELFNKSSESTSFNNYSGITYPKGLRGLNMILFLFGSVFFDIFNSYESNYTEESFVSIMLGKTYSIYLIGMRYAPRILFSISGFVLFYKFMCFIDDKVEGNLTLRQEEKKKNAAPKKKSKSSNKQTKKHKSKKQSALSSSSTNNSLNQTIPKTSAQLSLRKLEDIPMNIYWAFFKYQLHRYFMFVLLALFIQFSLYKVVTFIKGTSPLWKQFYFSWIDSITPSTFIFALSTLRSFNTSESFDFFNYYWMISNEMFFFIIGSMIIFIGYRYQLRADRFILIIILLLIISKIIYYCVACVGNEKYASLYYYFWDYGKFILTPFYNLPYYLMGMFFGSLNYVLQKGIGYEEVDKQGKPFLNLPVRYVNYFQKISKPFAYFISIIGLIVILLSAFSYNIALNLSECNGESNCYAKLLETHMISFSEGTLLNGWYLIDMEVVLFFVHWIAFALYVKGNNYINDFLGYKIWESLDKCYYSYLLGIKLVTVYVVSQSDTRIQFDLENILLYVIIIGFWLFIVTIITYVVFELPYKRLLRLMHTKKEQKAEQDVNMSLFSDQILVSSDSTFDIEDSEEDSSAQSNELFDKDK